MVSFIVLDSVYSAEWTLLRVSRQETRLMSSRSASSLSCSMTSNPSKRSPVLAGLCSSESILLNFTSKIHSLTNVHLFHVLHHTLCNFFKERNETHDTGEATSVNILFLDQIVLESCRIVLPASNEHKLWSDASFLLQFVNCSPQQT